MPPIDDVSCETVKKFVCSLQTGSRSELISESGLGAIWSWSLLLPPLNIHVDVVCWWRPSLSKIEEGDQNNRFGFKDEG